MKLLPGIGFNSCRQMVLLAPHSADVSAFRRTSFDQRQYGTLLADTQRLRGSVYVSEGNLASSDLSGDGRHIQASDYRAWHLITVDAAGAVAACGNLLVHEPNVTFSEMTVSRSILARSEVWGSRLRVAVESVIEEARHRGVSVAEFGGWAVSRVLRCTTEAVRMLVADYALAQLLGGALVISTANMNRSAPILRRMGGTRLVADGVELPAYYEPQYRGHTEVLRFDSSRPNPRYLSRIQECAAELTRLRVFRGTSAAQWQIPEMPAAVHQAQRIPVLPMIPQPAVA